MATIGLTSWIIHEKDKKITSFIDVVLDPSLLLLIAGCIATLISFLGAIGALREHQTMLTAVRFYGRAHALRTALFGGVQNVNTISHGIVFFINISII